MPTIEEINTATLRDAMEAASDALGDFDIGPETDGRAIARKVLAAMEVARDVIDRGQKQLQEMSTSEDDMAFIETEPRNVVAAAFWHKLTDFGNYDLEDVHPNCGGSEAMLGFAAALHLLSLLDDVSFHASDGVNASASHISQAQAFMDETETFKSDY